MIASNSEKDKVLIADFTIWTFLVSSAFSSFYGTHHLQADNGRAILAEDNIMISYCSSDLYINKVPRRSPANIDRGDDCLILLYILLSESESRKVYIFLGGKDT